MSKVVRGLFGADTEICLQQTAEAIAKQAHDVQGVIIITHNVNDTVSVYHTPDLELAAELVEDALNILDPHSKFEIEHESNDSRIEYSE